MKPIYLILVLLALVAAGCASATPAAQPAQATEASSAQASEATLAATQGAPASTEAQQDAALYPGPNSGDLANAGYPSPENNAAAISAYPYPVNTTTGIEIVDKVVAAVTSTDHKGLSDLIHYTNAKCTKAQGLGGPPKCLDNEADGTPVDVLPMLGSEGSFLRKTDVTPEFFQGQYQLLAVFKVKPDANPDPDYPAGVYGVLLLRTDQASYKTLRVDDQGIVRIDDETGMPGKDFPKADEFILQLKSTN